MTTHRVSFEIDVPDGVSDDDLWKFLRFELGEVAFDETV